MTFNITVLTPVVVYQSADFRLTNADTGALIDDESNKTVTLRYKDWGGFTTYTGLGRYGGRNLSSWIGEWLEGTTNVTPGDVADVLRERAEGLFRRLPREQRMLHTFVLAAFYGDLPVVHLVSNFQNLHKRDTASAQQTFEISSRTLAPNKRTFLAVTGYVAAVTRNQRSQLKHLAREFPNDSGRMRRLLGRTNADAAQSFGENSVISRECTIMSLHKDGTTRIETNGKGAPPTPQLMHGVDVAKAVRTTMKGLGVDLSKLKIVQSVGVQSGAQLPSSSESPCRLSKVSPESTSYSLEDIQADDFEAMIARRVSESGVVIGSGRPAPGQPDWIPWAWQDGILKRLGFIGIVLVINASGYMVGSDISEKPAQYGIRFADGVWSRINATWMSPKGLCSTLTAHDVNSSGVIAGQLDRIEIGKGCQFSVPAVLYPDQRLIVAPRLEGMVGSRAMSINDHGVAHGSWSSA